MQKNLTTKFTLHFNPETRPLIPEEEILRVFSFLGLALICGRIDIPSFDRVVNGLITVCHGDFQCDLIEIKKRIKFILNECERVGV